MCDNDIIAGFIGLGIGLSAGKTKTDPVQTKAKSKSINNSIIPFRVEIDYGVEMYRKKYNLDGQADEQKS